MDAEVKANAGINFQVVEESGGNYSPLCISAAASSTTTIVALLYQSSVFNSE